MQTYSGLSLISLNQTAHARTCGYWYLIQSYGCTAHTAFATRAALIRWLDERGLTMTAELPAHGEHSVQQLAGSYRSQMHGGCDEFAALDGERTKILSNGEYTLGIITRDADGTRTEHYLNPNCRDRPVFDYWQTRAVYN